MPANEALPLSKEAALKTLELDPDAAEGHSSLGLIQCAYEWDWAASEASFRRALELQPGLALIDWPYSLFCLLPQLKLEEACSMTDRALNLDPFNPTTQALAIFIYANAGRFEDAMRQMALGIELNPKFVPFYYCGGLAQEWQGNLDEAISTFRRACELMPLPSPLGSLGHALSVSGEKQEARQILKRLLEFSDCPAVDLAIVHLGLREDDEALRWLEVAVEQRNLRLLTIPVDRRFRRLAEHPRFHGVMQRMDLRAVADAG